MRFFRFGLNLWITAASLLSFLAGWVALAHSPKPVQPSTASSLSAPALPTLAPLNDLQFGRDDGGFRELRVPNSFGNSPSPVFRTGGS